MGQGQPAVIDVSAGNGHAKPTMKRARRLARRLAGIKPKFSMTALRCSELNRIFRDRYPDGIPDDDAGRDDVQIMAHHLIWRSADARLVRRWINANASWMSDDEANALIARVASRTIRWRADTLAKRLNLTDADRTRLGIRTIGAVDMTREERTERRKREDRERKRRKREARGVKPRADSVSQCKPWFELGISRASWYRRRTAAAKAASIRPPT